MDVQEKSLKLPEEKRRKLEIISRAALKTRNELSLAYTLGVAEPSRHIQRNPADVHKCTGKIVLLRLRAGF